MHQPPSHLANHRHLTRKKQLPHTVHTHVNIILMVISIIITIVLSQSSGFEQYIVHFEPFRPLIAVLAGIFFVITFVAPIGGLVLAILAHHMPLWQLILLSGFGAVCADLTILRSLNTELLEEVEDIVNEFHGKKLIHIIHSKVFRWTLPLLVIFIIVSPLPDSLVVGLLGISRVSTHRFAFLSYFLNSLGIVMAIGIFLLINR